MKRSKLFLPFALLIAVMPLPAQDEMLAGADAKAKVDVTPTSSLTPRTVGGEEVWEVDGFGLFPTVPYVKVDGEKHLILSVELERAIIEIDGERQRLRGKHSYVFERGPSYVDAFIEASNLKSISTDRYTGDTTVVSGRATADRDLKDVYVAIVQHQAGGPMGIDFTKVGDLKAGQSKGFRLDVPVVTAHGSRGIRDNLYKVVTEGEIEANEVFFFPIFYQGGKEIPSQSIGTTSQFFNERAAETLEQNLDKLFKKYEGQDQEMQLIEYQAPDFSGIQSGNPPGRLVAKINVGTDGMVDQIAFSGDLESDRQFREAIVRAVRNWQVMPSLEDGEPQPGTLKIPFEF